MQCAEKEITLRDSSRIPVKIGFFEEEHGTIGVFALLTLLRGKVMFRSLMPRGMVSCWKIAKSSLRVTRRPEEGSEDGRCDLGGIRIPHNVGLEQSPRQMFAYGGWSLLRQSRKKSLFARILLTVENLLLKFEASLHPKI